MKLCVRACVRVCVHVCVFVNAFMSAISDSAKEENQWQLNLCKMIALIDVCRLVCVCVCIGSFLALIWSCSTWIEPTETGALHFSAPYGHECMSYYKNTNKHTHFCNLPLITDCCLFLLHAGSSQSGHGCAECQVCDSFLQHIIQDLAMLGHEWLNNVGFCSFYIFIIVAHLIIFSM